MAQKKRKKKTRWLRIVLFVILAPLIAWSLAFVLWLYWRDEATPVEQKEQAPATQTTRPIQPPTQAPTKAPQERINEQDRRKLEEILEGRR